MEKRRREVSVFPSSLWGGLALLAGAFSISDSGVSAETASNSRHIVMVVLEDVSMRWIEKRDPEWGNPAEALTRWADENAVTFRHAYANASVCNPSRAAIFTCRLPEQTRVFSNRDDWRPHGSVVQYLKDECGFHTARVDKIFHQSKFPHPQSWSEIIDDRWPKPVQPPIRTFKPPHASATPMAYGPSGRSGSEDGDFARAQQAIGRIASFDATKGKRLCLMVGLKSTHLPFRYPSDYSRREGVATGPVPKGNVPAESAGAAVRRDVIDAYYRCLQYELDCTVAILEAARRRFGENLVSVVVSDHGFALGSNGIWRKNNTVDEATRVPLFISAPGLLVPGSEVTGPFELARLMPTVLDLANVPAYSRAHYPSAVAHVQNGRMPPDTLATTYAGVPTFKVVRNNRFALHHLNGINTLTDLEDRGASSPQDEAILQASFARRYVGGAIAAAGGMWRRIVE